MFILLINTLHLFIQFSIKRLKEDTKQKLIMSIIAGVIRVIFEVLFFYLNFFYNFYKEIIMTSSILQDKC